MVGYDKHFGKEENCPLCNKLKKKNATYARKNIWTKC